ncbi:MAG TPA: pyridoxal phosphate-dependent aminotransferase, partial [Vicinamibacteria bacterium]|nr:pyridoxal phosphate-dependent aminotransferase [Vicinamibacteria bacterium]
WRRYCTSRLRMATLETSDAITMTPRVSSRGRAVPASPIRNLVPLGDEARRRGVRVLHLNIGQPDIETPAPLRERLQRWKETVYAYTPSGGTPEFLGALREYYARMGLTVGLNEVIATTGGSEAILFALSTCADQGDEALVVEPFYTNYAAFAAMAGVRLVPLTSRGEDGFHLPPREAWEQALSSRTRAVILCNPNNPTGTVYGREELEAVARFCRDHGLFLICDEVYREFAYDGRTAHSALSLSGYDDLVVMVDSLSKRYSACGIRLGCLVTRNRDVYACAMRMAQARLSPPGLAQVAAAGMTEVGGEYTRAVVAEYQARRDLLFEAVSAIPGAFLRKPEGAFYFVARLPVLDAEDFARWMLTDYQHDGVTVMVAPARGFYATQGLGTNEVRLAYVLARPDLERAVRALAGGLEVYRKARGLEGLEAVTAGAEPDFHLPDH